MPYMEISTDSPGGYVINSRITNSNRMHDTSLPSSHPTTGPIGSASFFFVHGSEFLF